MPVLFIGSAARLHESDERASFFDGMKVREVVSSAGDPLRIDAVAFAASAEEDFPALGQAERLDDAPAPPTTGESKGCEKERNALG